MTPESDWRDTFCGRVHELQQLRVLFQEVAAGQGPRLAVVLGDRGMGKTRLIQELYRELTTQKDLQHYWPDAALFVGNNLLVAPDLSDPAVREHFASFTLDQRPMPFLWWGFRLSDPDIRNAAKSDLASHRATLDPHLASVFFARRLATAQRDLKASGVDVGATLGKKLLVEAIKLVPGVGMAGAGFELLMDLSSAGLKAKAAVQSQQDAKDSHGRSNPLQASAARERDILSRTLDDLGELLGPAPGLTALPCVVFCDDAQFARTGGDEGALRLLSDLWERAHLAGWPLFLVLTHWEAEWHQDLAKTQGDTCATAFLSAAKSAQFGALLPLPKEPALGEMVEAGLPNLPEEDVRLLSAKADGNPQLLVELIDLVRRSPKWRNRQSGALTPHARAEIDRRNTSLMALILERLESDSTPETVRQAVAISSVQGIEFLCTLTKDAARSLDLEDPSDALLEAQHPRRLILGVQQNVASFIQRAYREAATALLSGHVGSLDEVKAVLLSSAIALGYDDGRMNALTPAERTCVWGLVVYLAEDHPDENMRLEAGSALLALIASKLDAPSGADYARAAELALRFEDGLNSRWPLSAFSVEGVGYAINAMASWHGPARTAGLCRELISMARADLDVANIPERRRDLHVCLGMQGRAAEAGGDWATAENAYRESLELIRALAAETGAPIDRRNVGVSCLQLGAVLEARGDLTGAISLFKESVAIARECLGQQETPGVRRELSSALDRLGRLFQARGDLGAAEAHFYESLSIAREVFEASGKPDDQRDLCVSLDRLGEVADAKGDPHTAKALYQEALTIRRALLAKQPTQLAWQDVCVSLERAGLMAHDLGDLDAAAAFYTEWLSVARQEAARLGTPENRSNVLSARYRLAFVWIEANEIAAAEAALRECLAEARELSAELGTPVAMSKVAGILEALGLLACQREDWDTAATCYCESHGTRVHLHALLGTLDTFASLALVVESLGRVALGQGDVKAAEAHFQESLLMRKELAVQQPMPLYEQAVHVLHMRLGTLAEQQGDKVKARAHCQDAVNFDTERLARRRDHETTRDMGLSLWYLASLAEGEDQASSRETARHALALFEESQRFQDTPKIRDILDEARECLARWGDGTRTAE